MGVTAIAALIFFHSSGAWTQAAPGPTVLAINDSDLPFLQLPGHPAFPPIPGIRNFGANDGQDGNPGVTAPLVPATPQAPDAKPSVPKTRAEALDELFHRLAAAKDSEEADGIALVIQHVWLQSGSDTADLLMSRAATAAAKGHRESAISLLDKVVVLDPTWAEGWNKRATLKFLNDDDAGAMEDISRVLTLEPRHFGALSGMASILLRQGMKKEALGLLRDAATIYPHNAETGKLIEELSPDVDGRDI